MPVASIARTSFLLHARRRQFNRRVKKARRLIANALDKTKKSYIAYSTGKDSLCMAHLVWEQAPDTPAVYFDADAAYPESKENLWTTAQDHPLIIWPCEPILDTFKQHGGPTAQGIEYQTMKSTVYEPIERLLEKYDLDGAFVGLRAAEAWGREQLRKYRGGLFWSKRWSLWECCPVLDWSYKDVWAYIFSNGLDYNKAYDKMWEMPIEDQRISYCFGETKKTHGRWAWLRRHYPDLYNQFVARFPEVARYT